MKPRGRGAWASTRARRRLLFGSLIGLVAVYLGLLPWLRHTLAETRRLEEVAAAQKADADRLTGLRESILREEASSALPATDPGTELQRARRDDAAGFPALAARHAERAAAVSPNDPEPRLLLADIRLRAHQYDAAMRSYRVVMARDPLNRRARIGLASLYISFGWPSESEALLTPVIQQAPRDPHPKVALAAAYMQRDDFRAAERLLLEVRRMAPADAALWSPLVQVHIQSKRYHDAIATTSDALRLLPDSVPLLNAQGDAFWGLNDLPAAIAAYRNALSIQSDNIHAHFFLALCHQRLGHVHQETAELEYVLRRAPAFAQTRLLLGRLYLAAGRTAEGHGLLTAFEQQQRAAQEHQRVSLTVATRPRSVAAHLSMARCYRREGDPQRELVELRRAVELNPRDGATRRRLSRVLQQVEQPGR